MSSQYFVECFCEYCTLIKRMNPIQEDECPFEGDKDCNTPFVADLKDPDSDTDTLTKDECHKDDMSELMARDLFEKLCVFGDFKGVYEVTSDSDDDIPQSQNKSCSGQADKKSTLCVSCGSKNHDRYHCANPFKAETRVPTQIGQEVCGCSCQSKCSYATGVSKHEMDIGGLENADDCLTASHRILPVLPHEFDSSHQKTRVRDCCDVTCSSERKELEVSELEGIRVFPTGGISATEPNRNSADLINHLGDRRIVIASSICKQDCAAYSYMRQYLERKFQSCRLCNIPIRYTPERWVLLDDRQVSKPIYGLLCDNCVDSLKTTRVVKVRLKYGMRDFIHVRYVGNT